MPWCLHLQNEEKQRSDWNILKIPFLFHTLILYFGLHLVDPGCYDDDGLIEVRKEDELEEMPQVRWKLGNSTVYTKRS